MCSSAVTVTACVRSTTTGQQREILDKKKVGFELTIYRRFVDALKYTVECCFWLFV